MNKDIKESQDNFIKQLEKDMRSPEFGSGVYDGKVLSHDELKFLDHSNRIEGEYSKEALQDAAEAWKYIKRCSHAKAEESYVLTFDSILHCHYLLMYRMRPDIAGRLRTCDVWIGNSKKTFISEQLLEDEIRKHCQDVEDYEDEPEDDKGYFAKTCHIDFEHLHPFEDGNGRTGRIVYNAHRLRLGLPIHIIHEEDRFEYYKWFSEGERR